MSTRFTVNGLGGRHPSGPAPCSGRKSRDTPVRAVPGGKSGGRGGGRGAENGGPVNWAFIPPMLERHQRRAAGLMQQLQFNVGGKRQGVLYRSPFARVERQVAGVLI